jgi:hypothetical protein
MVELTEQEKKEFREEEARAEWEADKRAEALEPFYQEWKVDNMSTLQKEFLELYSSEFEDFCRDNFSEVKR